MNEIRATQVKAARALLGLSQEGLAIQTGLSTTTIRKIENGEISPRASTMNAIRQAVEDAGWEFIYPEGIRRRQDSVMIYEGVNSVDHFFDDMLNTVKKKGGEIYCLFASQDMLIRSLGAHDKNKADRLDKLNEAARKSIGRLCSGNGSQWQKENSGRRFMNNKHDMKWVMVAGPYSSGGADAAQRQRNLDVLNKAALAVFEKGFIPVIGVNCALPLILLEGREGSFDRIMMPLSLAMSERCDACLRVGGPSKGADQEVERFRAEGKSVFFSLEELP